MAKFSEKAEVDKNTEENQDALKDLGLEIKLVDKTTGEKYIINDENASALRFKERKKKLFIRIKGESGVMISIPQKLLPNFIEIETKKREIW